MYCQKCGHKIAGSQNSCTQCGGKSDSAGNRIPPSELTSQSMRPSSVETFGIVIVGLFVLIVIAALLIKPWESRRTGAGHSSSSLNNVRSIGQGCLMYAIHNSEGMLPNTFDEVYEGGYVDDERYLEDPFTSEKVGYALVPGLRISDPHGWILIYSKQPTAGMRRVFFVRGFAQWISEAEFEALLDKQHREMAARQR